MSVAFNPPISSESNGLPVLVIGVENQTALVVDDGGRWIHVEVSTLTANWRYDWRNHRWIDVGETDATQDDAPDGGEEFPRHLPEPNQLGQGHPLDPQGEQTPGDPGDLDTGEAD